MSIVHPRTTAGLRIIIALSELPSCRQLNPKFCEAHPQDVDCARLAGIDAGACTSDMHCPEATPVCDVARSRCIQCTATEPGACGGTTPVCGPDETCRGCALDSECASLTCLPDHSCASLLDVLYVNPNATDLATCMPDDHCSLARALSLVDGTKATIRLDRAIYALPAMLTLPNDLHLVGRDAVLDRVGAGTSPILVVPSNANITIDYVTVQGGEGASGSGIQCSSATLTLREITVQNNGGAGISTSNCVLAISDSRISSNGGAGIFAGSGALTISDSRISSNGGAGVFASSGMLAISHSQILDNRDLGIGQNDGSLTLMRSLVRGNGGGGLLLTRATFDLENDIIVGNGSSSSAIGGIGITFSVPVGDVFAFNTVAQNQAADGTTPGVVCVSFATPVTMTSSIVFGNGAGSEVGGNNCTWTYSDIGPTPVPGTGNRSGDPLFVDPAHDDFHLQASSPARDAADPAAMLAVDIDGDPRPKGARRDMGADEIP